MDSLLLNPLLILGNLTGITDLGPMLRDAAALSNRAYQFKERLDEAVLAQFSSSSIGCCVVVDEGDGVLALAQVRQVLTDLPQTPVLLLTARHTPKLEMDAIATGADDCVSVTGLKALAFTRIIARTMKRADRRRRLLGAIPTPLLHATLQGIVHWANGAFLTLFRCADLEQVRTLGLEPLIHTFAQRLNRANAPADFASQQVIAQYGGSYRDVVMMISCLDPLAPEEGVQVTFTDITAVETQRRQLDIAERRARELYDNSPVMMYTLSVTSIILEVNNHWLKQMGYERDEVIGASALPFHGASVDFSEQSPLWQPLQSGEPTGSTELQLVTRTGTTINGLVYATAVHAPTGELVAARLSVLDLTDFKRAQSERDHLERELRLAQKLESVGQLAAGIAHEINTPAQFVSDNLAFLESAFHDMTPLLDQLQRHQDEVIQRALKAADVEFLVQEAPKSITQAQDGIRRIRKIVLALKEFSHPGSDEKTEADLNHVIENTTTLARGEWKHVAELNLALGEDLPAVFCNPSGIAQVVLNMVVNAAHAIADHPKTEKRAAATISIATRHEAGQFVIAITDTGCGMSEEVQGRIFDPFFTTKEVGRGSGQGLSIARSIIVDQHQGSISVASKVDVGTTFTIRLPLAG